MSAAGVLTAIRIWKAVRPIRALKARRRRKKLERLRERSPADAELAESVLNDGPSSVATQTAIDAVAEIEKEEENVDLLYQFFEKTIRHALTGVGLTLASSGYMQETDVQAFVGGIMVIVGMFWSWGRAVLRKKRGLDPSGLS